VDRAYGAPSFYTVVSRCFNDRCNGCEAHTSPELDMRFLLVRQLRHQSLLGGCLRAHCRSNRLQMHPARRT
jgi:hypothetical protein